MNVPRQCRFVALLLLLSSIGLAASRGDVRLLPLTFLLPVVALYQTSRIKAYLTAVAYYAAALYPMVETTRAYFFYRHHALILGIVLWFTATGLLSIPWALFRAGKETAWWRGVLALSAAFVPPLAFIAWASPLAAAGSLFPGTSWIGLAAVIFLPGIIVTWPRAGWATTLCLTLGAHAICRRDPAPPPFWEAIDTAFTDHGADPISAFETAQSIQNKARQSSKRVIVFPEAVVSDWNEATDLFWEPTITALRSDGKTMVVGASIAVPGTRKHINGVVIRGKATSSSFYQRIPMPVGMWRPWQEDTFEMSVLRPGTVTIDGERAAILMCHEILIPWPIVAAAMERPTVIVGLSNVAWARSPRIMNAQRATLTSWARLFAIPKLIAVNRPSRGQHAT